jgi:hypothetical protein
MPCSFSLSFFKKKKEVKNEERINFLRVYKGCESRKINVTLKSPLGITLRQSDSFDKVDCN